MSELIANMSVEQAVLGTMLMFEEAASFAPSLRTDDFGFSEHAQIFEAIQAAVTDGRRATPVTLGNAFASMQVDGVSGGAYLGRLVCLAVPVMELHGMIQEMRDYAGRRHMRAVGEHLASVAGDAGVPAITLCAEAVSSLDMVASTVRQQRRTSFDVGEVAAESIRLLREKKKPDTIRTGLTELDTVLGGWHRGELAVIGGRPSMGKSAFLFSTLRQAAKVGTRSLIFSLEMRNKAVVERMLSDTVWNSQTPIPFARIMNQNNITEYELERLERASVAFEKLPIRIDDQPGLTIAEISARTRRHIDELARQNKRLDVVAIDHIGKIAASNRYAGNVVREVGEKVNALFNLGRELDVAMVVLTQLSRSNEKRENRRAEMSDVRESGDIEQDADTMLFPYRPEYYLENKKEDGHQKEVDRLEKLELCRNLMEIDVAKNRNGPRKTLELFCAISSNAVRDMAK